MINIVNATNLLKYHMGLNGKYKILSDVPNFAPPSEGIPRDFIIKNLHNMTVDRVYHKAFQIAETTNIKNQKILVAKRAELVVRITTNVQHEIYFIESVYNQDNYNQMSMGYCFITKNSQIFWDTVRCPNKTLLYQALKQDKYKVEFNSNFFSMVNISMEIYNEQRDNLFQEDVVCLALNMECFGQWNNRNNPYKSNTFFYLPPEIWRAVDDHTYMKMSINCNHHLPQYSSSQITEDDKGEMENDVDDDDNSDNFISSLVSGIPRHIPSSFFKNIEDIFIRGGAHVRLLRDGDDNDLNMSACLSLKNTDRLYNLEVKSNYPGYPSDTQLEFAARLQGGIYVEYIVNQVTPQNLCIGFATRDPILFMGALQSPTDQILRTICQCITAEVDDDSVTIINNKQNWLSHFPWNEKQTNFITRWKNGVGDMLTRHLVHSRHVWRKWRSDLLYY